MIFPDTLEYEDYVLLIISRYGLALDKTDSHSEN